MRRSLPRRLVATAAGVAASRYVPDLPDEVHPVARFGRTMGDIEARIWRDDREAGASYAAAGVLLGAVAGRAARSTAVTVAVCAAGGQLRRTAGRVADRLDADDLDGARALLPGLVGRDPSALDGSGIAAAAIESVAENTVDAVFAPAFWAVLAGAPGAAVHRAVNTMDAMVGRHDERYERFGWASARLDDAAAWVPARLFAATVWALCPARRAAILAAVRDDAPRHPSPNAGVAEAAVAAALGCELGGPLRYGEVTEDRPTLGSGPRPGTAELREAIALAERAETALAGALAAAALLVVRPGRGRR
jgi:adenosylcobinamide-phosphate synthase